MNNVYRRQPIVHQLPAGWSDLDAVNYNTLSNIKGIQQADNVTIDQNSTYDCKNIFQDSSNNITVRPALRPLEVFNDDAIEIKARYETAAGILFHFYRDGRIYIGYNITEPYVNNVEIGDGKVIVTESAGKTYILCTDIYGKLSFLSYIKDEGFKVVEGVVNINSPDNPSSRLYNLLNNKYYYEIWNTDYDQKAEFYRTLAGPEQTNIDTKDIIDVKTIFDNKILIITNKGYYIYEYRGSVLRLFNSGVFTEGRIASCYVTVGETVTIYACLSRGYEDPVTVLHYTIDKTGLLIHEHTQQIAGTEHDAFQYKPTSTGGCMVTVDIEAETFFEVYDYDGQVLFSKNFGNVILTSTCTDKYILIDIDGQIYVYTYNDFSVNNVSALNLTFDDSTIYLYFRQKPTFEHTELSVNDLPIILEHVPDTNPNVRLHYIYNNDWHTIALPWQYDENDPFWCYPAGNDIAFVKSFEKILVFDTGTHRFTEYEYAIAPESIFLTALNSGNVILFSEDADLQIHIRERIPEKVITERKSDENFPVVTDIEDEVLTGFYLDNIYWFVTKHRVFGTGVANENFTVEYFDPRKYFYFDEELTAAIRISDTSFWVFHKNGAYLIYKSASEIYDNITGGYVQTITWLVTNTAKSKGCDFENGVITLPVTSYIASVTADDISSVQMRENVQTDDRILVPITLPLRKFVSKLLSETSSVIIGTYKYNALFFLNRQLKNDSVPVLVYNTITESWWYWELPIDEVKQVTITENNINILARHDHTDAIYDLYENYYDYKLGGLTYHLYADRHSISGEPVLIEWFWKSAVMHFGTVNNKKQLLLTNFTFSDEAESYISFDYKFGVYSRSYSESAWSDVSQVIERAKTYSCKNVIANFAYLQLYIKNCTVDEEFVAYTKPKFSAISFKYRVLSGGMI